MEPNSSAFLLQGEKDPFPAFGFSSELNICEISVISQRTEFPVLSSLVSVWNLSCWHPPAAGRTGTAGQTFTWSPLGWRRAATLVADSWGLACSLELWAVLSPSSRTRTMHSSALQENQLLFGCSLTSDWLILVSWELQLTRFWGSVCQIWNLSL